MLIENISTNLWRADRDFWKVETLKRVDGDRGGHRGFLPSGVGVVDQNKCSGESKGNNGSPEQLAISSLRNVRYLRFINISLS